MSGQSLECRYCGWVILEGDDVSDDPRQVFPVWESIRRDLFPPYHRTCRAWHRIDRWLEQNVPATLIRLGGVCKEESIVEAGQLLHRGLPRDIELSLRWHDGSGGLWLFRERELLTLESSLAIWRDHLSVQWAAIWREIDALSINLPDRFDCWPPGVRRQHWHANWLPLIHNGGGDYVCVDLDPAPGGVWGQIFHWSHEIGPDRLIAASFGHYLEEFAASLEANEFVEGRYGGLASVSEVAT